MIIIKIFVIYSISYFIRNLSGPFNIFGIIRNKLMNIPSIGVFFYELLNCPWCIGFHCGYLQYLLTFDSFKFNDFIFWGLAGSSIVYLLDKLDDFILNK